MVSTNVVVFWIFYCFFADFPAHHYAAIQHAIEAHSFSAGISIVICAAEDVGLADPQALILANAAAQAATAYLHANDSAMPGNANRIITNGTSAGGGVSLYKVQLVTAPTSNHIYKH